MLKRLVLVIAESALETVPEALWWHPEVRRYARDRGLKPGEVLLDRSYHHRAMRGLRNAHKRGRPDIVHFSLLNALETPLAREGLLDVYVHTVNDKVLEFNPEVRLPRNYMRFKGLIEQLFKLGRVPPDGEPLITLRDGSLAELKNEVKPAITIGFSTSGEPKPLDVVVSEMVNVEVAMAVVGGFPHGDFEEENMRLFDVCYSIDPESLNTWVVVARLVYEVEKNLDLHRKRLERAENPTR
ncbi:16S rRNA methyltransferase [Candidatus Bathyarchaeota archaeon]|nr:MAG: 16S rRNA methyltransferase [Candidatus Bathyarchaeota archaeon]